MKSLNFNQQFSYRLKHSMLAVGLHSSRSVSGVCIQKLVEITGYSIQICRRYLRGESIPELQKLIDIAKHLNVSPGWLLFGEDNNNHDVTDQIILNKDLLYYIFIQIHKLYANTPACQEMPIFFTDLLMDVSQIQADDEQLKKIVDLALSSVKYFENTALCYDIIYSDNMQR